MDIPSRAELSIIVTIVDGGRALVRCLDALVAQVDAPRIEVIVPFDTTIAEPAALADRYPDFRFLDIGQLLDHPPANAFDAHELFDRRRTAGLKAATAPLLAMIEDRGWPRPDWARAILDAHRTYGDGVVGGAVECVAGTSRGWAVFFLDFGRYQAPFDDEQPEYVTDTNVSYRREALEAVRPLWEFRYQEAVVNWALRDKGISLRLTAAPVTVQQRDPLPLGEMALERFHWGRVFGEVRARGKPFSARLKWIASIPLLPPVLYVRHLRRQMRLRRHVGTYLAATPMLLFLLTFWAIGELRGYLEAEGAR
jgi:hypothetical protein